jgi:hypothetical protein
MLELGKLNENGYKFRLTFTQTHKIFTGGIDFGPKVFWEANYDPYYIVRVPGHQGWSGIGLKRYYPTTYYLMKTLRDDNNLWGQMLYEIQPGVYWKKGLELIHQKARQLKEED